MNSGTRCAMRHRQTGGAPRTSFGRSMRGVAIVELALVLPVLLILVLGVIDFARAIQFNNILVHMTREGANLAARTTEEPSYILKALMDTATPMEMNTDGMMYITQVMGDASGNARLVAQYRPTSGGKLSLPSKLTTCNGGWSSGKCEPRGTAPIVPLPNGVRLNNGETVYAVESMYDYTLLTRFVIQSLPQLYSLTIL